MRQRLNGPVAVLLIMWASRSCAFSLQSQPSVSLSLPRCSFIGRAGVDHPHPHHRRDHHRDQRCRGASFASTSLSAKKRPKKVNYIRPSTAIETGSGFFIPFVSPEALPFVVSSFFLACSAAVYNDGFKLEGTVAGVVAIWIFLVEGLANYGTALLSAFPSNSDANTSDEAGEGGRGRGGSSGGNGGEGSFGSAAGTKIGRGELAKLAMMDFTSATGLTMLKGGGGASTFGDVGSVDDAVMDSLADADQSDTGVAKLTGKGGGALVVAGSQNNEGWVLWGMQGDGKDERWVKAMFDYGNTASPE